MVRILEQCDRRAKLTLRHSGLLARAPDERSPSSQGNAVPTPIALRKFGEYVSMRAALSQVHQLIDGIASSTPDAIALAEDERCTTYAELRDTCRAFACGAMSCRLTAGGRVGVFLPKQLETVISLFGTSAAGGTFVPINPILKPAQVAHIVEDCDVQLLVTSTQRWQGLGSTLKGSKSLTTVIVVDGAETMTEDDGDPAVLSWASFLQSSAHEAHRRIDRDMAAILYTSGSTGKPRGVVISHRNLIAGAESVSTYLANTADDRLLAVLPLSFDAGLSQLTTAFNVGATAILMDYLLPQDVLRAIERHKITGLAAVPSLWNQLARLNWPPDLKASLRYITNTGGALPVATTKRLTEQLPDTQIFLMYGLTEAFRSTYLPPSEVSRIPESIGKAIPNADILVINKQGKECRAGEPGELVHRGDLVTLGYWNDPASTAVRFRPLPGQDASLPIQEIAVWSGDTVVKDEDGFLYFVARNDEMIKTSGYRVSPTEIEELAYSVGAVSGAAAVGLPHPMLGQAILLLVTASGNAKEVTATLDAVFKTELPWFMRPRQILLRKTLPQNQNGKTDRRALRDEYANLFAEES